MANSPKYPLAVVMGLSPTGLHAVRTLSRLGADVVGVGVQGQVGSVSKHLSHFIADDGKTDIFEKISKYTQGRPAVLIPTSDEYVELISQRKPSGFMSQPSYRDGGADLLLTKSDFYDKCAALGMRFPRTITLEGHKSKDMMADINLPAILKPSRIHDHKATMRGKKGWIVVDDADLDSQWHEIGDFPGEIIAQEFIPGPESEIRLVAGTIRADQEASSVFTARKLRQYPRGMGSASVVQSSDEPEAAEMALRFLNSVGYEGIFGAEMKRHAVTGELYFIEINPRTSLWFSVSEAAGCEVVQQSFLDVINPTVKPIAGAQRQGVRWRYLLKDVATQIGYALRPHPAFPKPDLNDAGPVRKQVGAVYEAGDVRPVLIEPFSLIRKAVSRAASKAGLK